MATYKTKDGSKTGFVPGVGAIKDGFLRNAPDNLESPNLEKVTEEPKTATPPQTESTPKATTPAPTPPPSKPVAPPQPPQNETPKPKESN